MHHNCKVLLRFPSSKGGRCGPLVPRGSKSTGEGVPEGCRRHWRALGFPAVNWLLLGAGGRTPTGATPGDRHARAGRAPACLCGAHPPAETATLSNYAFELSSLATDGKPLRPQPGPDGGGGWTKRGGWRGMGGVPLVRVRCDLIHTAEIPLHGDPPPARRPALRSKASCAL